MSLRRKYPIPVIGEFYPTSDKGCVADKGYSTSCDSNDAVNRRTHAGLKAFLGSIAVGEVAFNLYRKNNPIPHNPEYLAEFLSEPKRWYRKRSREGYEWGMTWGDAEYRPLFPLGEGAYGAVLSSPHSPLAFKVPKLMPRGGGVYLPSSSKYGLVSEFLAGMEVKRQWERTGETLRLIVGGTSIRRVVTTVQTDYGAPRALDFPIVKMDRVEGSLRQRMEGEADASEVVFEAVRQICALVGKCVQHGIRFSHRDAHVDNIFYDGGAYFFGDLGMSCVARGDGRVIQYQEIYDYSGRSTQICKHGSGHDLRRLLISLYVELRDHISGPRALEWVSRITKDLRGRHPCLERDPAPLDLYDSTASSDAFAPDKVLATIPLPPEI